MAGVDELIATRRRRAAEEAQREAELRGVEKARVQAETRASVEAERAAAEERARQETSRSRIATLVDHLRGFYHPKQRRFVTSTAPRRATKKTRRSGATAGGCRELIARALETPRFRAVYATDTRINAEKRAWRNDTQSGFVDIVERYGEKLKGAGVPRYDLGSVVVEVRDGELALEFSNGSKIELFGADNESKIMDLRGLAKHVYWVDEAQDFTWLERFYKAVVTPGMSDFGGECWLTGTPGRDPAGMFFEITRDDDTPRLQGWEVHEIEVTDNPFFGRVVWEGGEWFVEDNLFDKPGADRTTHPWTGEIAEDAHRWGPFEDEPAVTAAAVAVRWERAAAATIRANGWSEDDPDVQREWRARWVKEGMRYVYPVHSVPKHVLLFAPQRLVDNPFVGSDPRFDGHPPWYDHVAAVRDLPRLGRDRRPHKWLYSLWLDDGFFPDPFAIMLWAFTPTLRDIYEMFSWKMTKVDSDDKSAYVKRLYDAIPEVVSFGGDAAGMKGDFAAWRRRLNLPVDEADKAGRAQLQEQLAADVRAGRVHLREGSPLYLEMSHLIYLPTKPGKPRQVDKHRKVNGVVHGDHCCFVARTMVATETGAVPIEDVRAGMRVHVRSGLRPVVAAFFSGIRPTWRLELDDDSRLIGTYDHPIWTARGWTPLSMMNPGTEVTPVIDNVDGKPLLVRSVEPTGRYERVYNLTVAGEHEYFANGVLVSNCDAARYGYRDLTHYLSQLPGERPPAGSMAALREEAEREERILDQREARERALDEQDEEAAEYAREGAMLEW